MKYYSTNRKSPVVAFSQALLSGIAPDGGLYMPEKIPVLSGKQIESFHTIEYYEIAYTILNELIGDEIASDRLMSLCKEAYNFDVPVEKVYATNYIMRLDQGPTASFKDFAARMMSRLMQHFLSLNNRSITILTATSGDTGSAVASAFYGLDNIRVIILFPIDEVTPMQRKQMTTLNGNIYAIGVKGKFDDCQSMAKMAFRDPSLSNKDLSSANSINIGRLLPQSVYYFYAWARLTHSIEEKAIFSVPSGNFGNLMGGLLAKKMGLPVKRFVISTNSNNEVPEFLKNGCYNAISPSINCLSSAMNVGHPSNLARIVALYGGIMDENGKISKSPDINSMREDFFGVSITDEQTIKTIKETYKSYSTILEPHGAVGWQGLAEYLLQNTMEPSEISITLETAHPAKFYEELRKIIDIDPILPDSLRGLDEKDESFHIFDNDYRVLKEYIQKYF